MLSSVTLIHHATKIVMNWCSQLSELQSVSQMSLVLSLYTIYRDLLNCCNHNALNDEPMCSKEGWKAIRDKRKHHKPGGTMQTSEVNKWTFRSRIGSLGTLGDIIFDILEPPAVEKYSICWVFLSRRHKLCLCICEFVFVYLCIWQKGISVLMSLDPELFKNIAL